MNRIYILVIFFFLFISCISKERHVFPSVNFPTSRANLDRALDSFFNQYPSYQIPDKWKDMDNWAQRGLKFEGSRIFYFASDPEELFYVLFEGKNHLLNDKTNAVLFIMAIKTENSRWLKYDDLDSLERVQVQDRFQNEVILKLEEITNTKSKKVR